MKNAVKTGVILLTIIILSAFVIVESRYEAAGGIFFAMDTVINISIDAKNANEKLEMLEDMINNLDSELSRTEENSLIYRLNHSVRASAQLSDDAVELLNESFDLKNFTDGAFDISIAPVMDIWGFTKGEHRVPTAGEIEEALKYVGMEHIHLKNNIVSLDSGSKLDLGGIAKGFALEKAKELFKAGHVKRGIANMGGDILAYNSKANGEPWTIAVQDPQSSENESGYSAVLKLRNSYVMTSGNYQRYFIQDGVRYHHILDPHTGCPARSGLSSVTVVADAKSGCGPMCDALSTALFVMGKDKAIEFWRNNSELFDFVIITDENEILVSEGLQDAFVPLKENKYTCSFIH